MSACKVLFCGEINSQFDILLNRLNALQNSAAGPFHVLFIVGPLFKNYGEFHEISTTLSFPIPTYIYDTQGIPTSVMSGDDDASPSQMPMNLNVMSTDDSGVGMATVMNLTIAYCIDSTSSSSSVESTSSISSPAATNRIALFNQQLENIKKITNSVAYRGSDLFLSSHWPMDCHQFLETELLISSGISFGPSSATIAKLAMQVLPRYHFAIGKNIYFQRPPYINSSNSNSSITTATTAKSIPCTRFIGLAKVSESKEKEKKYLHALSLTPIIHMNNSDVGDVPIGSTDCPYQPVTTARPTSSSTTNSTLNSNSSLSVKRSFQSPEPPPPPSSSSIYTNTLTAPPVSALASSKRMKVDPSESNRGRFDSIDTSPVPASGGSGGAFFFGQMGASRPVALSQGGDRASDIGALPTTTFQSSNSGIQTVAPNDTIKTLFIGGLNPRSSDRELTLSFPGACKIHRPEGKSFAFVDFNSHSEAAAVVAASLKQVVVISGRQISIGWGKDKSNTNTNATSNASAMENVPNIYGPGSTEDKRYSLSQQQTQSQQSLPVQLEPPSLDATCLFVGGLPSVYLQEDLSQTLISAIMNAGVADSDKVTVSSNNNANAGTTMIPNIADTKEGQMIVSVRPVLGKSFCFVNTSTHDIAAALVKYSIHSPVLFKSKTLSIGWANSNSSSSSDTGVVTTQPSQSIPSANVITLVTTPPSGDAKTLFAGNINNTIAEADILSFFLNNSNSSMRMNVQKIHVFKPAGKSYAFIDFASHDDALFAVTLSTTAGMIIKGTLVRLGWAKGSSSSSGGSSRDSSAADCWFCLASPSIKAHLILSVGEHVYLALPRGAITKNHVLIVPIDCCSSRIMFSADTKKEFHRYEQAIESFNRMLNNNTLCLLFERTLRTRGRDHMQTHLVPLTQQQAQTCLEAFLMLADKYGLRFTEIQGEEDIDEVVLNQEEGPYQEYFYIQIPIPAVTVAAVVDEIDNSSSSNMSMKTVRKFIYVPPPPPSSLTQSHAQQQQSFPMMFGLEVAAYALGQPEKSNWKNCLLSEAEEEEQSGRFKQEFSAYDFTVNDNTDEGEQNGGLLTG